MKKNNSWKCVPKRRDALAQLRRSAIWLFLPVLLFISLCASCGQEPAVVGMDAVPTESGVPPAQDVRSVLHIAVLGFAAILGGVFLGVFLSRWKTQRDDRVTQQIVQRNGD